LGRKRNGMGRNKRRRELKKEEDWRGTGGRREEYSIRYSIIYNSICIIYNIICII
jgi:hypothetical protein